MLIARRLPRRLVRPLRHGVLVTHRGDPPAAHQECVELSPHDDRLGDRHRLRHPVCVLGQFYGSRVACCQSFGEVGKNPVELGCTARDVIYEPGRRQMLGQAGTAAQGPGIAAKVFDGSR